MLCSVCKKQTAIIFYNNTDKEGKTSLEGYCYDCAKAKGINPSEVLAKQNDILSRDNKNIDRMSKQMEAIFKDLSENLNFDDLQNMEGAITFDVPNNNEVDDEDTPHISGAAIPIGSIFTNMFSGNSNSNKYNSASNKRIKVEEKKNKKKNKMNTTNWTALLEEKKKLTVLFKF